MSDPVGGPENLEGLPKMAGADNHRYVEPTPAEKKYLTIYCAARFSVWWSLIWQFGYAR